MTTWRERAHGYIATLEIPADADLKACRKIFREKGGYFHGGTYWGRKAWGKATREWLIHRGLVLPPKQPLPLLPADIIFPYREAPDGPAA
jgi:hypothetical protein